MRICGVGGTVEKYFACGGKILREYMAKRFDGRRRRQSNWLK
jgi:hypothetical protein